MIYFLIYYNSYDTDSSWCSQLGIEDKEDSLSDSSEDNEDFDVEDYSYDSNYELGENDEASLEEDNL